MTGKNPHYKQVIERLGDGKDSPFEIGEVTSYNPEKMTIKVLGLRTQEEKENVLLAFPNLYMNSGMLMIPLNKTKGLLYVGPDSQNYFLPIQFHLPYMDSEKGKAVFDASPSRIDPYINFNTLQQGEFLLRHITGTQLAFWNTGSVDLATNKGHHLSIDSKRGELQTVFENMKHNFGYSTAEAQVIQPIDSRDHAKQVIRLRFSERGPEWKKSAPIPLSDAVSALRQREGGALINPTTPSKRSYELDLINVVDSENVAVTSSVDNKPLFLREYIALDKETITREFSKGGAFKEEWVKDDHSKTTLRFIDEETTHYDKKGYTNKKTTAPHVERFSMRSPDGETINVEVEGGELSLKTSGVSAPSEVKISKSETLVKNGQVEMLMKGDDIIFKTPRGSVSINSLIQARGGGI